MLVNTNGAAHYLSVIFTNQVKTQDAPKTYKNSSKSAEYASNRYPHITKLKFSFRVIFHNTKPHYFPLKTSGH